MKKGAFVGVGLDKLSLCCQVSEPLTSITVDDVTYDNAAKLWVINGNWDLYLIPGGAIIPAPSGTYQVPGMGVKFMGYLPKDVHPLTDYNAAIEYMNDYLSKGWIIRTRMALVVGAERGFRVLGQSKLYRALSAAKEAFLSEYRPAVKIATEDPWDDAIPF